MSWSNIFRDFTHQPIDLNQPYSTQGMEGKFLVPDFAPFFYPKVPCLENQMEFGGRPSIEILTNAVLLRVDASVRGLESLVRPKHRICASKRCVATGCRNHVKCLRMTPTETSYWGNVSAHSSGPNGSCQNFGSGSCAVMRPPELISS